MAVDSTAPAQASQEAPEATQAAAVKPASRLGIWVNRALFVILIVTPLTLYFLGYISTQWANSIGILMDLFAGFMLAPELIGEKRLKRFEIFIEHAIVNARNLADKAISTIMPAGNNYRRAIRIILEWCAVFALLAISWILELYYLFYLVLLFAYLITIVGYVSSTSHKLHGFARILYYISAPFVPLVLIGILPLFIIFVTLMLSLYSAILLLLNYLSKKMSGDDRLRSILVWWGIIFFIVGNALQFIASF
jgi:hypothetical protein